MLILIQQEKTFFINLKSNKYKPKKNTTMKEELLNNGIEVTETRQINKASLYFGLLVITCVTAIISIGMNVRYAINKTNLEYQITQRDSIMMQQEATINELTYDNINLANNK